MTDKYVVELPRNFYEFKYLRQKGKFKVSLTPYGKSMLPPDALFFKHSETDKICAVFHDEQEAVLFKLTHAHDN